MTKINKLHENWLKDPAYRDAYGDLEPEFQLAKALIDARSRANMSQSEVASRMGTTQSVIARLESGTGNPSMSTLKRFAKATGAHLQISMESH